jgi:1A family penicillin-binding protein
MLRKLTLFLFFFILFAAGLVLFPLYYYPVSANTFESKESIMNRLNTGVILLDRHGEPLYKFYQARHNNPTPLSAVPTVMQQAVIAAEDREFYRHDGFSPQATAAALVANLRHKEPKYGGSTITQQLVKNSLLTPKRDYVRKYQEIALAIQLERKFRKEEILEMYLNSVYFGEGAFGVEEAAKVYFDTPLDKLDLAQSSLLAALLVAPSTLTPISGNRDAALVRQKEVLSRMQEEGFISEEEKTQAAGTTLTFNDRPGNEQSFQAPHFALMVRDELIERYGEEQIARSGFIVKTTLDLAWQKKAETAVQDQLAKLAKNQVDNAAAVVLDPPTGEIRALVGSRGWEYPEYGKYNVATARRQPGSSFKPVVYLAALESRKYTPSSILKDRPRRFGRDYKPENYDRRFRGDVSVRYALANSLNVPTVEVQQEIGVPATLDMARRLGIRTLENFSPVDLSVSLGAGEVQLLELTNAYATIADQGKYKPTTTIASITDKYNRLIYTHAPEKTEVVDPRYTFLLTSILSDPRSRRDVFGTSLDTVRPAAAKTGTSQSYKDSWTVGFTPELAVGVWVGNHDGRPMDRVAGSMGAAPIWRSLMDSLGTDSRENPFATPAGIVKTEVCRRDTGLLLSSLNHNGRIEEYFAEGTEPKNPCAPPPTPTPSESPSESPSPDLADTPDPARIPDLVIEVVPTASPEIRRVPPPNVGGNPLPTEEPAPDPGEGSNENPGRRRPDNRSEPPEEPRPPSLEKPLEPTLLPGA